MGASQRDSRNREPVEQNWISEQLERAVRVGHSVSNDILAAHPYHVMFDLGLVVIALFVFVFAEVVRPLAAGRFLAAFVFTTVTFEVGYVRLKRLVFGIYSRSYLQDLLAYVLPVWVGTAVLLGVDPRVTLDLVGLQLPLLLGFIRVGCFFGGCCYGVPTKYGVRYPPTVFESHDGNCQSFSPGADPGRPVLPVQLLESAFNFAAFAVLFVRLSNGGVDGTTLPLYLSGYALYRFFSDFFRASSARPNWGPLSEAQWVCLLLFAGIGAAFSFGALAL